MLIRPLESHDRIAIGRILCQDGTFNEKEVQVALELVDEVLKLPLHPDYQIFSAVLPPDVIAGFICFGPVPLTDHCYDLYWIAVDSRYHKKGVGSRLLGIMEDVVREKSGRYIYVDTSSSSAYAAARSFYKKHGYRMVCVLDNFYRQGDHKVLFQKKILS